MALQGGRPQGLPTAWAASLLCVACAAIGGASAAGSDDQSSLWSSSSAKGCTPVDPSLDLWLTRVTNEAECFTACRTFHETNHAVCPAAVFNTTDSSCWLSMGGCSATPAAPNSTLLQSGCLEGEASGEAYRTIPQATACECRDACATSDGCAVWQRSAGGTCRLHRTIRQVSQGAGLLGTPLCWHPLVASCGSQILPGGHTAPGTAAPLPPAPTAAPALPTGLSANSPDAPPTGARNDSTPEALRLYATGAALLTSVGSLSGQRILLGLPNDCGLGVVRAESPPFPLHPTGLRVGDGLLAAHVGALVGNTVAIVAVFAMAHTLLLIALRRARPDLSSDAAQGTVWFPSLIFLMCLILLQGTSYSAARLALSGDMGAGVSGGVSFAICVSFIGFCFYVLRQVGANAVFKLDNPPAPCSGFFVGSGEWASLSAHFVERYSILFRGYLPVMPEFLVYDMAFSLGISLAAGARVSSMHQCGHKRVAMVALSVVYLLALLALRPYASSAANCLEVLAQILFTVGLAFTAAAFYSDDESHWGFSAGSTTLCIALGAVILKVICGFAAFLYRMDRRRQGHITGISTSSDSEMLGVEDKTVPLVSAETSLVAASGRGKSDVPDNDLSWEGLMHDLTVPVKRGSGSAVDVEGQDEKLTWSALVNDIDTLASKSTNLAVSRKSSFAVTESTGTLHTPSRRRKRTLGAHELSMRGRRGWRGDTDQLSDTGDGGSVTLMLMEGEQADLSSTRGTSLASPGAVVRMQPFPSCSSLRSVRRGSTSSLRRNSFHRCET